MSKGKNRLTAVLCLIMAIVLPISAISAPAIADVPKDHWAYEAVAKLVEKGYLGVYSDGTFKGDEPVSRYLLAFVVVKMLSDLEKGTTSATDEDMGILREVANELRGEIVPLLAALDSRVDVLEADSIDGGKALTAERQERKAEAAGILAEIESSRNRTAELGTAISKVEASLSALEAAAREGTAGRAKADAEIQNLTKELESLKQILGKDIDETASELAKNLEKEARARAGLEVALSVLEDETVEDLAAAMASIREWAEARHGELASSLEKRIASSELALGYSIDAKIDALRESIKAEDAAIAALIADVKAGGQSEDAELRAKIEALKAALSATDMRVELLNRELVAIKGALGQDIQKAVSDLSAYLEGEANSRKLLEERIMSAENDAASLKKWAEDEHKSLSDEFAVRAGELERAQSEELTELKGQIAALKDENIKEISETKADLTASAEVLRAYIGEEARLRTEADEALSLKLVQIDKVLGADIEKSITALQAALASEKQERTGSDSLIDAKILSEVSKLKAALSQQDDDAKTMIIRNTIELQDRDDELALSIADLRVLMDSTNVSITSIKERMASVEGRLTKIETSADILRAGIETNSKLLVSLSDDLSRIKSKQEVLEVKVADLQSKSDSLSKEIATVKSDQETEINGASDALNKKLDEQAKAYQRTIDELSESNAAQLKKVQGLGITGLVIGILGLIVGIVAIFLPITP